jgi:hypothetical protein
MRKLMLTLVGVGMLVLCGGQIAQAHGPGHHGHGWGPRPAYGYYHGPRGYYGSYYRGGYGYGWSSPYYAAVPYPYPYIYAYPAPGLGVATRNFSFFVQP